MGSKLSEFPAIRELADRIATQARQLEEAHALNGQQDLEEGSEKSIAKEEMIQKSSAAIVDGCRALMSQIIPPEERLKNKDRHDLTTLRIIHRFHIASYVPLSGTISYRALSRLCNLPKPILTRILHQAMTYDVFCEPQADHVAHSDTSRFIPSLGNLFNYQFEICLPSAMSLPDSLQQRGDKPMRTAFQLAHKTTDNWWDFASKNGNMMEEYGEYQRLISQGGAHDVCHVLNGYAWAGLEDAFVADIGGGSGSVAIALAHAYPNLYLEIQDFPALLPSFKSALPSSLKGRVNFAPHSFFDPQPASQTIPDVFLLRHILHDWPTPDCHRILLHLIRGLSVNSKARIIVAEQVIPSRPFAGASASAPASSASHSHQQKSNGDTNGNANGDTAGEETESETFASAEQERLMRALDMQMMSQFGSQERTRQDWEELFSGVGLKIVGMQRPKGSADIIMEVALA
ncbi:MAG: hypothetical protein Q9179_001410 [Wetmoreana sp. 5 TL-2023]